MCKRPTDAEGTPAQAVAPLFKPFSAFRSKQFIRKMAARVFHALRSAELADAEALQDTPNDQIEAILHRQALLPSAPAQLRP
jgi:hypothetical protein